MKSGGECLVYGRDEVAIEAAKQLAARLSSTVILTRPQDVIPPRLIDVPIFAARSSAPGPSRRVRADASTASRR